MTIIGKTKNISEFGYSFQVKFIVCLITDKLFLEQIVDILDEKYINNDGFKWVVKTIREYYKDFDLYYPSWHYSYGVGETRIGKNKQEVGNTPKESHEILIVKT